MVSTTVALS